MAPHTEKATLGCFTLCAVVAAVAILDNALNKKSPNKVVADFTQLLIIIGYAARILNKQEAFSSEKIFIVGAALSCACTVFFTLDSEFIADAKSFSAGSMGAWNVLQMIRWHQTKETIIDGDYFKWAILALLVYSLGALVGYASFVMSVTRSCPAEGLEAINSFASLMSTYGNLFRTVGNKKSGYSEKYTILIAGLFGFVALIENYFNNQEVGAYSKLIANLFSGSWNALVVTRLYPDILKEIGDYIQPEQYLPAFSMFRPPIPEPISPQRQNEMVLETTPILGGSKVEEDERDNNMEKGTSFKSLYGGIG